VPEGVPGGPGSAGGANLVDESEEGKRLGGPDPTAKKRGRIQNPSARALSKDVFTQCYPEDKRKSNFG